MATVQERLAESLKRLQKLQDKNGLAVVKGAQMSRTHLTRLTDSGFLQEVMKGWYISSRPDSLPGDTTNWYTSFWFFVAQYARSRFGKKWCLSPELSLSLYSGCRTVPRQVMVRTVKASNNVVGLLHGTSILCVQTPIADPIYTEPQFKLNLYPLVQALAECSPDYFRQDPVTVRTCLSLIVQPSDLLKVLLEKGQSVKAGRMAGAFRNIGNSTAADEIMETMKGLGYDIREEDPFEDKVMLENTRVVSPYATRLKLMWQAMRGTVLDVFPKTDRVHVGVDACMRHLEAQYSQDAYHSLSIEGYRVADALIEKVRRGGWRPDSDATDSEQRNSMAARGYWQAFQAVKESVGKILSGENPGEVADNDHRVWYRELFAPSVTAGILKPADLAGYRTQQVCIRGSKHTPFNPDAVRDAIPVLFDLLKNEPEAIVRAVLGHFFFVYIHPYMDGNGRIGRFLMNTMLISGGYDWTIVPVEKREQYMAALEKASGDEDITDFARLVASFVQTPVTK